MGHEGHEGTRRCAALRTRRGVGYASTAIALAAIVALTIDAAPVQDDRRGVRTLAFTTSELTQPDLSVSPDGQTLIVSALGHLFRIPAGGGTATQLTFGPSYDNAPVFSPDGSRVAFLSDRDGSGGNVFVLDLATRTVTQVTREAQADLPAWSADGRMIAYVRVIPREDYPASIVPGMGDGGLREIRTVSSGGGASTRVGAPLAVGALFHLPDGRLGWTVPERSGSGMFAPVKQTRVEARGADGTVALLGTIAGDAGRAMVGPAGDGLVYASPDGAKLFPFAGGTTTGVAALAAGVSRLAVARRGNTIYFASRGRIWRTTSGGAPEAIDLTMPVSLEVRPPLAATWTPSTGSHRPQAVVSPQLSPDGTRVVFMAAGFLWEQSLDGGEARRLFDGNAFDRDPSFSPDGRMLAYVTSEAGHRALHVYDFATRQRRTLLTVGGASWLLFPNWKPDGSALVVQRTDAIGAPYRAIAVTLADGKSEELVQTRGDWTARPHFASDGRALYFTGRMARNAALYRVALGSTSTPEAVTSLTRHVNEALVAPDGTWLALRRNAEIWIAPMAGRPVQDADLRRFSAEGGRSFSFTSDSSAIVYSAGGRIWRQPVRDGARVEIPVRLTLSPATAAPTLVRRARILDVESGRLGEETSLLIENGRIRWIGADRDVPANAIVVDAAGRVAMPGLFDLHVHSGWASQQASEDALIAFGITSVRDTGGSLDVLGALDDRSTSTALPAPRYFYSGEIFEGAMPMWGDAFLQIATDAEAREHVQRWKTWGADFIKVYPSLPWHLQRVVADEAHRVGLPVVGHGLSADEITRRVVHGYASLEHSPQALYDDLIGMLAAAGTRFDATLTIWGGHTLIMRDEPARLTTSRVRTFVPEGTLATAPSGGLMGRQPTETLRPAWKARLAQIKIARDKGVKLGAGTDSLMSGTMFGVSLHWELEHFVEAGLTPAQALRLATLDAAEMVGAAADLGTLAPGKLADLVLLDRNPLEDIRNTQSIWRVIKGGYVFDPSTLRTDGADFRPQMKD